MAPGKKALEKSLSLLAVCIVAFSLAGIAFAGTVVIKPGQFDHFTLQMPDRTVAGENAVVKVSVYDSNNNLITNFSETGKEFRIDVSGSAAVQPSVLGPSSFSGGMANVVIADKKAERVTFSIKEAGGTVPVISRDFTVMPNKLDHFVLQSSSSTVAGAAFDVKVVAKDIFENTVQDLDIGKNVKVTSTGTSSVKMLGSDAIDFKSGTASASFVSEKAGEVVIELQDTASGSKGKTQAIQVAPAALSSFRLQAPKTAVAGEPFELLVTAYDSFNNIVANYAGVGGGIRLSSTGSSKIEPAAVSASEFRNGQASIKAVYEKAEDIQIVAREANRDQTGRTSDIQVSNAMPDHFMVITPDSAVSGQKFKVKVEAFDRFNNIVKNFNLVGSDVALSTSGSGSLSLSRIPAPEFSSGIAVIEVMYDKAESFQISARMMSDRTPGRISVSGKDARHEVASVPARPAKKDTVKAPDTGAKPVRKKGTKEAAKPVQEKPLKAVKKEAPKAKAEVKKPVEPKKEEPVKEAKKQDAPRPKADVKKEEPKKAAPRPDAKPLEKKPSTEVAKKEDKKPEKALYNVSKVSIIEAKNKAMLVVNITNPNGHLDHSDEIESKYGKQWLKLQMKPAVNGTDRKFKFSSAYIGEVLVEEDKAGGQDLVNIYIELIPSGVTYDIARVKNTLVVTLSNP